MNHQTSRSHDPSSFTLKLEDFKPPELDFLIKHELHLRRGWAAICVADTPLQMLHHLGNIAQFIKMLTCLQINMSTEFVKVTLTYIRNNYKLFNWDGDSVRGGGGQVHVTFSPTISWVFVEELQLHHTVMVVIVLRECTSFPPAWVSEVWISRAKEGLPCKSCRTRHWSRSNVHVQAGGQEPFLRSCWMIYDHSGNTVSQHQG